MVARPPRGLPEEIVASLREGRIGNAAAAEWAAIELGPDEAPGEFDHLRRGACRRRRPLPSATYQLVVPSLSTREPAVQRHSFR
jgi:hypothetical protein